LVKERTAFVDALSSLTNLSHREPTRCFLEGLSRDELQYIAAYLGARTLDPELAFSDPSRDHLSQQVEAYEHRRCESTFKYATSCQDGAAILSGSDAGHKMILLLEFLMISAFDDAPKAWRVKAGSA
jgi:hypothetical protein